MNKAEEVVAALTDPWPAIRREDGRCVEIVCPHGVGHPVKALSKLWEDWMGVHGCDLCCASETFRLSELYYCDRMVAA